MSNLVIVAIPDENERVWKLSSEKVPHLTLLFLGDMDQVSNLEQIVLFVEHAASLMGRFHLSVDRRGELGADQADVIFFKKTRYEYKAIRDFRATLLQENNIKTAYDTATQFEGPWNPHLTLGYPATPAKPDDSEWGGLYSVEFNKIAVWTDDFDGPEFVLKDWWDEYETMDAIPMDVAMSDLDHSGVKGMKWGVRNENVAAVGRAAKSAGGALGKAASATARFAGDVGFENRVTDLNKREVLETQIVSKAHSAFKRTDMPAIKNKPEYQKAKKLPNRLLHPLDPATKAYRKEVQAAYVKRLEEAANSMTNISGTRQYTIRERGWELPAQGGALPKTKHHYWEVSSREIKHADGDVFTMTVEVMLDDDGFVTDLKEPVVAKTMAQTIDLGAAFLEHYGVKGQKWGVRHDPKTENKNASWLDPEGKDLSSDVVKAVVWPLVPPLGLFSLPAQVRLARAGGRAAKAKAVDVNEKRFAKKAQSTKNFVTIHNGASPRINREIDAINTKYPDISKPAVKKKYDDEILKSMQNAYRESANSVGNRANTMHLDLEFRNDGLDFAIKAREGIATPKEVQRRVTHAATDDDVITFSGKIQRASTGHIVGLEFDDFKHDKSMAQSVDLASVLISSLMNEELEHFGVKGMRWGVRSQGALTTKTHIDTGLARRRTQVVAKGGQSQPAHDDAIKAAIHKQKLKKSGTDALSNQELRELANRIQLENQVSLLTSSKGKQFVSKQLEEEGKQQFKKGVGRGAARAAPHVVRKVRRAAATGATVAALA